MKPSWRRLMGLLAVMSALVLAVAACGGDDDNESSDTTATETTGGQGGGSITIGTKDFTEQFVLGELYKQALAAKGFDVDAEEQHRFHRDHRQGPDERPDRHVPGVHRHGAHGRLRRLRVEEDGGRDLRAAKDAYEERGQTLLEMTPFSDSDAHRGAEGDRGQVRRGGGRRPHEDPEPHARGPAAVPHPHSGPPRPEEELRRDRRDLPLGRQPEPVRAARPEEGARGGDLLDRPAARVAGSTPCSTTRRRSSASRTSRRSSTRQKYDELGEEFEDAVNAVSEKLTDDAIIAMNSAVAIDQKSRRRSPGSSSRRTASLVEELREILTRLRRDRERAGRARSPALLPPRAGRSGPGAAANTGVTELSCSRRAGSGLSACDPARRSARVRRTPCAVPSAWRRGAAAPTETAKRCAPAPLPPTPGAAGPTSSPIRADTRAGVV